MMIETLIVALVCFFYGVIVTWLHREPRLRDEKHPYVPFTLAEIEHLADCPEAYDLAINYNECQATMADAIGDYRDCVVYHDERIRVLRDAKREVEERIMREEI